LNILRRGERVRVFIGIELSNQVKEYLDKVSRIVQTNSYKGNFTRFSNYHITIKYIGEATSADLDTLEEMMDYVGSTHEAFYLTLEDLGSFTKRGKHIIWMGLNQGKNRLKRIFNVFESLMEENGFERDQRKYQPHITLGKNIQSSYEQSNVKIPGYKKRLLVDKLTLFWSHREQDDLVYTPIYECKLQKQIRQQEEV